MKIFAERLKKLRLERGLSQKALAKELNYQITHTSICNWEQEKKIPKIDAIIVLAKYFNVSASFFAGLED